MNKVRSAIDWIGDKLEVRHPLAQEKFETDGISPFVRRLEKLLNASDSGQVAMQDVLTLYLQRVTYDEYGTAKLFFPFTRQDGAASGQPRDIVINPAVMWGRPVIVGTRIDTRTVLERFEAGESPEEIATDFGVSSLQVAEAVRCELGWSKRAA